MTKKVEFKRELILEDKDLFRDIVKQISQYKPLLLDLVKKYENLEIGEFSDEVYRELLNKGVDGIETRYQEYLKKQLDKTGVTSSVIRENMTSQSRTQIKGLKVSLKALKSFVPRVSEVTRSIPRLPLNLITYGHRSRMFYVKDEEVIKERYCRAYLENQREKDAYLAVNKMVDGYAEFLEIIKDDRNFDLWSLKTLEGFIADPRRARLGDPKRMERPKINYVGIKSFLSYTPSK